MIKVTTVGIAGLGLIGGSFAKAYKENSDVRVLGFDLNNSISHLAAVEGAIDGILNKENIGECDIIIPALYPNAVIKYVKEMAPYIRKDAIVIDTAGLKREICKECFEVAHQNGFTFVGGHPMAGKKYSGFKYSTGKLFKDASMIVVPENPDDQALLSNVRVALAPCDFGRITVCSPEKHDEMIAFTSQLAHIVSNAYVKSPTAMEHRGYSAGSYKDLTRVAWLNEDMWTEIFMKNRDNLIKEIDYITGFLTEYRDALDKEDSDTLWKLLHDGKMAKENVDTRSFKCVSHTLKV
jgi:Prephenate dehydrogenase